MKDIFFYLHDNEDGMESIPKTEITEFEAKEVLHYIRRQEATSVHNAEERGTKPMRKSTKRTTVMAIAAAAAVACTAYAAAHWNWNQGIEETMRITEEQKEVLENSDMAADISRSCTNEGVTVTIDQCIVDNYYAYLAFSVSGYELPEGQEPCFDMIGVQVDGDWNAGSGGFYTGIVTGPDGRGIYADGSEIDWNSSGGMIEKYVQEDGTLKYLYTISSGGEKGALIGKPVHVEFTRLGTVSKAEFFPDVDGVWTLDWILPGAPVAEEFELNEKLGDSGATVIYAEISPVSFLVRLDFPRMEKTIEGMMEDGEIQETTVFEEAPQLTGVRLKDGTLLPYAADGPGSLGYEGEDSEIYVERMASDRVLNLEEVDALLFYKSGLKEGDTPSEENYYVVPLR